MNPKVRKKFDALETQRSLLLKLLEKIDAVAVNQKPSNGGWSINQVLYHLIVIEEWAVSYLTKRINEKDYRELTGIKESIKYNLLVASLSSRKKFKAPAFVGENMPIELNSEELIQRWNEARSKLETILEGMTDDVTKRKMFKHPFIGYINIPQMLGFIFSHIHHHLPQIKRLL